MIYELRTRDVAEELRRLRKEQLMSLRDVAGQAGISASTISRIENGFIEDASFGAILALCNCYQVSVDELVAAEFDDPMHALQDDVLDLHHKHSELTTEVMHLSSSVLKLTDHVKGLVEFANQQK